MAELCLHRELSSVQILAQFILERPNQERYEGQRIFVVAVSEYAHLVPFVEDDREVFLKTIIPSRKATKKYLGK